MHFQTLHQIVWHLDLWLNKCNETPQAPFFDSLISTEEDIAGSNGQF